MFGRSTENPSRSEITSTVDEHRTEMHERGELVQETVDDLETEFRTLEALESQGTSEGLEEVLQDIEQAREVSGQEFDTDTERLEQTQEQSQEHQGELSERDDSVTRDREQISAAGSEVRRDTARGELAQAESAAEQDIEFLKEHEDGEEESRTESEQSQRERESRAQAARR